MKIFKDPCSAPRPTFKDYHKQTADTSRAKEPIAIGVLILTRVWLWKQITSPGFVF
jgi:hypothetical protein